MTNLVLLHFIGGWAFFLGIALCLSGCSLKCFIGQPRIRAAARITVLAGAVIVLLSAAPLPLWAYGLFFSLLALAVFRPVPWRGLDEKTDRWLLLLLLTQGLLMAAIEARQSRAPKIPFKAGSTMFVIGDSLSMGADAPGKNWPEILGDLAQVKVRNLSFGGARVASSIDHALRIDQEEALVILEIGGNDLLGGTSIPKFREDLGKMLALVCRPGRRVAMIELPLPPLYNRFGMVQRELARAHGVTLIPRRYLARVICAPNATVDGLHLSNTGHTLLARSLFEMFTEAP